MTRVFWPSSIVLLATLLVTGQTVRAAEIGYLEDFSLASDRTEALRLLIPGSEDYYYYHCLHYQNQEQSEQVEELLKQWIKRYRYTPRVREIQNRQALLSYPQNDRATLAFLQERLGLRFEHQRERLGETPNLPTQLDPQLITRDRLTQGALRRYKNLDGFEDSALDWLTTQELDPDRRRNLLERLQRPDHAPLPELIVADLQHRFSKPFGSMAIHRQLLLNQLDALLRLKPDLRSQTQFVNIYLTKLRPNNDLDWRFDEDAYEAYLDRLWAFVGSLPPSHNSLKASVLYHRLEHDRGQGVYDKQRFLQYIRLPRRVSYIRPSYLQLEQNRRYPADLQADFRTMTMLPIVGDDEPLVRSYLHHFFVDETSAKAYAPYVSDEYLRHHLAETKIVNGLGEAEQWYSWLSPAKYQALKDRIDLDFAHTNRRQFAPDETVALDVDIKNVRTLIVKVFEINTTNYYRQTGREVNTDINLDGLVPNEESTLRYDEAPLRRIRRHFEFPSLEQHGVYVIDFIGNGLSSRAVIRKGKLYHHLRRSTAGHIFTVLDSRDRLVKSASLWLSGQEYHADDEGRIVVPYSTKPGRQTAVLSDGRFSSLATFQHAAENYKLQAGFYVDREALLRRNTAQLVVRPGLTVNGIPVTLSIMKDIRLLVTATDQDGVVTTQLLNDFELLEDRESVHELTVPPQLSQLRVELRARIRSLSRNDDVDVATSDRFQLNQIDSTEHVEDVHLARQGGEFLVQLLGKSGEPRPDRPLKLQLKHRDFRNPVRVTLQTDREGIVRLGELPDIAGVTATTPADITRSWPLRRDSAVYPNSAHGVAGSTLRFPFLTESAQPARADLSLLELRDGTFVADRFAAVEIENGMLLLQDLPPGDYDLMLKRLGHRIRIRLSDGELRRRYVLGRDRHLEVRHSSPLQIANITAQEDELRIQLNNISSFTRVHVLATHFAPEYSVFDRLSRVRDAEPGYQLAPRLRSLYVAGRNIGDEYQYIIDRKYAPKFPGVMLDRPGILLNPWAVRDTSTTRQDASEGSEFAPSSEPKLAVERRGNGEPESRAGVDGSSNLDFLPNATVVLLNLEPNDAGLITVPLEVLQGHQHIHTVAIDPQSTVYRQHVLDDVASEFRDLRLASGLDPEEHFTQQKQITVIEQGDTFTLDDIATSRFEVYDSLSRVYALFGTLTSDPNLAKFGFVLRWPKMSLGEKQTLYSEHACHELNFFIFRKDPAFFRDTVRPSLANKRNKTFLDSWLLEQDVSHFLQPWQYARLNVVERILLAQRIERDRPYMRQDILDRFALLPPDRDRFNTLFLTALAGSALESADKLGLQHAQSQLHRGRSVRLGDRRGGAFSGGGGDFARSLSTQDSDLSVAQPEEAAPTAARMARPRAKRSEDRKGFSEAVMDDALGLVEKDGEAEPFFRAERGMLGAVRRLYEQLEATKEWAENNYYQLPVEQQNADLITENRFWSDFALHDSQRPFYTPNLADATHNFTEMMLALSLLDLPFESADHDTQFEQSAMTLTAASPAVIFHEEIRAAATEVEQTAILVSQNFFRHGNRYRYENNERIDNFVKDEFLVHTVYGCQVVITNPTSTSQKLDVLMQVPVGAMPVLNTRETRSAHIQLDAYNTITLEYHFYFPASGRFPHYPVHVSRNDRLLAAAEPLPFVVVDQLSRVDRDSWDYISQHGSRDDVLDFLRSRNLHRIDLSRIAFRMKDRNFFLEVVDLLERRHVYDHVLWSYSIRHNQVPAIRQYLSHADDFVQQCGLALESPLLTIDPVQRKTYQHLEYRPLINARAHQLGRRRQILNERLHAQYHQILKRLSYDRQLDSKDLLAVTYYLLLQDRISEALATFERIDASRLETRLQYDYFASYLAFYRSEPEEARKIATAYLDHPVDRWRTAFVAIDKQVDEIDTGKVEAIDVESRDQVQAELALKEPSFDFEVEARHVEIQYQNLTSMTVNYYLMDIELLFSRNPFVKQSSGQFSSIRPNLTNTIELTAGETTTSFALPEQLRSANVLVELHGGGKTKSQAYFANSLAVQVNENYGQLQVTSVEPRRPLAKVYVKIYAELKDGSVRFYKDGYTDLRGRFDYSSLSTNELDNVNRFSLLIISDDHGAVVREAHPPKQ
jgi:hypothetical protein